MSYAIATKELTLTDRKLYIAGAIEAGIQAAIGAGIGTRKNLVAREAMPFVDFGGGGIGWTLQDWYRGPAIAAAGWGSVFNFGAIGVAAPTLLRTKVAVFYKFQDSSVAPLITAVRFRVGTTGASTKATFFIQMPTQGNLEPDVYFSEPVVYEPEDVLFIEANYSAPVLAGVEQFSFGAFVIERVGPNVS